MKRSSAATPPTRTTTLPGDKHAREIGSSKGLRGVPCRGCGANLLEWGEIDSVAGLMVCIKPGPSGGVCAVCNPIPLSLLPSTAGFGEHRPGDAVNPVVTYLENQEVSPQARGPLLQEIRRIIEGIPVLEQAPHTRESLINRAVDVLRILIEVREDERKSCTAAHNTFYMPQTESRKAYKAWTGQLAHVRLDPRHPIPPPPRQYERKVLAIPKDNLVVALACVLFSIQDLGASLAVVESELVDDAFLLHEGSAKKAHVHQFLKKIQVRVGQHRGGGGRTLMNRYAGNLSAVCGHMGVPFKVHQLAQDICREIVYNVYLGGKKHMNAVAAAIRLAGSQLGYSFSDGQHYTMLETLDVKAEAVEDAVIKVQEARLARRALPPPEPLEVWGIAPLPLPPPPPDSPRGWDPDASD